MSAQSENASLMDNSGLHSDRASWLAAPSSAPELASRISGDILRLLDYFGRRPDRPLDSAFSGDGRYRSPGEPPKTPEPDKTRFLTKTIELCEVAETGQRLLGPDELGFLYSAREFLAAAAAPVTVETIAVTAAYLGNPRSTKLSISAKTKEPGRATLYGRLIAQRRARYQVGLIVLVLVTIWLTMQTFAIQKVLTARDDIARSWSQNSAAIQATLAREPVIVAALAQAMRAKDNGGPGGTFLDYCDYPVPASNQGNGSAGGQPTAHPRAYISFEQERLCSERRELRAKALAVQASLRAWATGATPLLGLLDLPSALFRSFWAWATDAAAALHRWLYPGAPVTPPPPLAATMAIDAEMSSPEAIIFADTLRTEVFAAGVLEVLLPALWALIGALVAVFRRLERRCATEQLRISDFPAMRTSLVLGVMVGAAIGMFADLLRGSNHAAAVLSTAALGLLAGYAADQFFTMIDTLVRSIFTAKVYDRQ